VLVCDGAGWHQTGGQLVVPDNVTLLALPSYSPQLNPIENVWACSATIWVKAASIRMHVVIALARV